MSENSAGRHWLVIALVSVIVLPLLVTLVMAVYTIATTTVPMVWSSWSVNVARLQQNEARTARIEEAARKASFRSVCPDYFDASTLSRLIGYRSRAWCEDYRDRMSDAQ
ncbi:hypothetical protein [Rhizobium sp. NXC24]|uniref:hypothetical protein n=1 Tax=Rhizobium sp. NXC24 TaxID=2048897 RepID=UPI000CF23880|nr:hypothetical protein [Rhizobium sp. NXC24]